VKRKGEEGKKKERGFIIRELDLESSKRKRNVD
jgi:hypothetical protein